MVDLKPLYNTINEEIFLQTLLKKLDNKIKEHQTKKTQLNEKMNECEDENFAVSIRQKVKGYSYIRRIDSTNS